MMAILPDQLESVFGIGSKGATPQERAASSDKKFVRSQILLAEDSEKATGHRMSASEALRLYGWELLFKVAQDRSAALVTEPNEPAKTLKARRHALNLKVRDVARSAGIPPNIVEGAEVPGRVTPIRHLERIAQALALNEQFLGYVSGARGDELLGVRLREFSQANDARHFSPSDVLALAEAAWVITTQSELLRLRGKPSQKNLRDQFIPDGDYSYPTFRRGYVLASTTRELLNIGPTDPIPNLKRLVEETLGIPVVQQSLANRFAGATLANRADRGIVVNEQGQNSNVWVRRMTIAHELGHLLWDPDSRLNKLKVDQYDELQTDYRTTSMKDPVEIRTNAFSISFLAPPDT
jgi:hypothetical protein